MSDSCSNELRQNDSWCPVRAGTGKPVTVSGYPELEQI